MCFNYTLLQYNMLSECRVFFKVENRHGVPPVINENFIIQLIKNARYT